MAKAPYGEILTMADIGTDSIASTTPQKRRKTRQRVHKPPPTLDVPDINDNAPERKRVLNVLAQRRYRQRKRQQQVAYSFRQNALESGTEADSSTNPVPSQDGLQAMDEPAPVLDDSSVTLSSTSEDLDIDSGRVASTEDSCPALAELLRAINNPSHLPAESDDDVAITSSLSMSCPSLDLDPSMFADLPSIDYSALCPVPTGEVVPESIPEPYLLPIPELRLLQAFIRLAHGMNCKSSIWDLTATSPINDDWVPTNPRVWTSSFAPTVAQRTVPHHPLIDFLPWPSVRDKLINIFSLPSDLRPPAASGPLAIVQLAYDMEDSAEGIRIWGHSPCNCNMWEIGQALFQRWWFVFDRQIIEQSNRWRSLRGAPELKLAGDQERVVEL